MNKATFTEDQVKAAKDIAKEGIKIWHAASVIGPALAKVPADDQNARTAFWKSLAAEMSYGPHAEYWTEHRSSGRTNVTDWAAFYRAAEDLKFDPVLAFSGGKVPTVASVKAFTTGRDSLDVKKLVNLLTVPNEEGLVEPFTIKTVKDSLSVMKRGPKTKTKATKADKATKAAAKAITDEARADAKAIVAEAHSDQKAVTLGRMVSFIADQADEPTLATLEKAISERRKRNAAAEAI